MFLQVKKGSRQQMPECRFGSACTRPGCIYTHSKGKARKSDKPCLAYVAGFCEFTDSSCNNRHPEAEECEAIKAKFSCIPCRFGTDCRQKGCLYFHPQKNLSAASSEFVPGWLRNSQPSSGATVVSHASSVENPVVIMKDASAIPQRWPSLRGDWGSRAQPRASKPDSLVRTVRIPEELWVEHAYRNSSVYSSVADVMERFRVVNKNNNSDYVVDLHFQLYLALFTGDFEILRAYENNKGIRMNTRYLRPTI